MAKPIIAIDIDDVLADTAEDFIAFSNRRWQTNLTLDDYSEHWAEMWQIQEEEALRRGANFFGSGAIRRLAHKNDSVDVLAALAKKYAIVATTSRRRSLQEDTAEWLAERYPGIFTAVHHAGIYDNPNHGVEALLVTKADLYRQVDATYVIDDQLKHCLAAAESGLAAVLFGDYPWNQADALPLNVTRAADWRAVKEFFDAQAA